MTSANPGGLHDKTHFEELSGKTSWILGALFLVMTLIAFGPALGAGFIWDDDVYVTQNPLLTAQDGLGRIWFSLDSPSQYFPLTYTTFYVEHAVWGFNPAGYHLINILLHGFNALLAWRLLERLRVPGAWLAGAIFALHPVQVESVAWITERKNVLMGLFFFLSLLAWVKFIKLQNGRAWIHYTLALVFFGLALFAKTTACTLPAALLMILWLEKSPINLKRIVQIVPFVALGAGMGLLTIWWERFHQGTQGKLFEIGLPGRILIASRAFWFYLGKLIVPVNLTFSYPRWQISLSNPADYVGLLGLIVLGIVIWRIRRYTGRGVETAATFFAVTLAPVMGFIMLYTFQYSFVADHYQYLACLGPIALFAASISRMAWGLNKKRRFVFPGVCILLLTLLASSTWLQCETYADGETLWKYTLEQNPTSWLAHTDLGQLLLQRGETEDAKEHFEKALKLEPGLAKAHYNLGVIQVQKGENTKAVAEYRMALSSEPNMPEAHNNLGAALLRTGQLDEAIVELTKALSCRPNITGAHMNLGIAFDEKKQFTNAISEFKKVLETEPDNEEAHKNLGVVFAQNQENEPAMAELTRALEINSNDVGACDQLSWLLSTSTNRLLRNGARAVSLSEHAADLAGHDNPAILRTVSAAYAEAGDFKRAQDRAQRGLNMAKSHTNTSLIETLGTELKLFNAGKPMREPAED